MIFFCNCYSRAQGNFNNNTIVSRPFWVCCHTSPYVPMFVFIFDAGGHHHECYKSDTFIRIATETCTTTTGCTTYVAARRAMTYIAMRRTTLFLYFVCCYFVAFLIRRQVLRTECSHIVLQRIMLCVAPHCNGAIVVTQRHVAAKFAAIMMIPLYMIKTNLRHSPY